MWGIKGKKYMSDGSGPVEIIIFGGGGVCYRFGAQSRPYIKVKVKAKGDIIVKGRGR
jgi:hypothetical protein